MSHVHISSNIYGTLDFQIKKKKNWLHILKILEIFLSLMEYDSNCSMLVDSIYVASGRTLIFFALPKGFLPLAWKNIYSKQGGDMDVAYKRENKNQAIAIFIS